MTLIGWRSVRRSTRHVSRGNTEATAGIMTGLDSQLTVKSSGWPGHLAKTPVNTVGSSGLEPLTSAMSTPRSNQLS